ncbi:hypothetical protein WMY93_026414 [Mugilogobius chulae]|uniref:Peptidase M12B propeptide domain-containing protein n=1 Tax=Mugilogobius chulae TaxID=88201 RepID=A0AAW0N1W4_9GOBI
MEKMLRPRWWISLLCFCVMMRLGQSNADSANGDALSRLKSLRNLDRFVGKEDAVPVRLLYSRHNHSQIGHDALSTRVRHGSSSTQGGEHCYYQGKIRDVPESFVALSTCHGLHGLFFDGNYTYKIEPREHDSKDVSIQLTV